MSLHSLLPWWNPQSEDRYLPPRCLLLNNHLYMSPDRFMKNDIIPKIAPLDSKYSFNFLLFVFYFFHLSSLHFILQVIWLRLTTMKNRIKFEFNHLRFLALGLSAEFKSQILPPVVPKECIGKHWLG